MELMSARTDALVRLPGTMIGKDSVAIKAAIAEVSADFQFQEESFFDEFLPAAQPKKAALLKEQEVCLGSLQTLLASAEADEKAKVERAEAAEAEAARKKEAEQAAEAERIKQKQELEEARAITEIALLSVRLVNSPPAEIRAGIEKISALTGSPELLDVVSGSISSLQSALAAAERREVEEIEKAEAAEVARLKAAEEERVKRETAAAAERAAKEEAAKKAAAEAEEKRKAKEAEEREKARERQDADLTMTINAVAAVGIDIAIAEKLLMAVVLGEIPYLSWSNKC
jgi:chemotaxis protein histidine kinase CheA